MSKKYVLKTATLSCLWGEKEISLDVLRHRHISAEDKLMANKTDITKLCISGFGECRSGLADSPTEFFQANRTHLQQKNPPGLALNCVPDIEIPWQNTKSTVKLAGYEALLENGWTVCKKGFGIITLLDSGQSGDNSLAKLLEMLQEIIAEAESFARKNGLGKDALNGLLMSVLGWNGYPEGSIFWNYQSDEMKQEFCKYLMENRPDLYGFFERPLIYELPDGRLIDLTYMMGIHQAMSGQLSVFTPYTDYLSPEILNNEELFHAYLEACCLDTSKEGAELLKWYIEQKTNEPFADPYGVYDDYLNQPGLLGSGETQEEKIKNKLRSQFMGSGYDFGQSGDLAAEFWEALLPYISGE